jgi:hypothetical protein
VPRNGSVNCTIAPEDDLVVAHLEAPLADIARLDLIFSGPDGAFEIRRGDIPFIPESGMRLLAIDDHGERVIGDYTFNHTPYAEPRPQ